MSYSPLKIPKIGDVLLVMFSGGIDSACILYRYLSETSIPIHAHHVRIMSKAEPRWQLESKAVDSICRRLRRIRPFDLSISSYEHVPYFMAVGWDCDVQLLAASRVVLNLPLPRPDSMIHIALGWTKDSTLREEVKDRIDRDVVPSIWRALCNGMRLPHRDHVSQDIMFPLLDMTKKEIMECLPEDILHDTWSCRGPVDGIRECGVCHACLLKNASSK